MLLLAPLLLTACGGGKQNTHTDLALFDQAYIPAFVLTAERGTSAEAVLAVKILKQEWDLLKSRQMEFLSASGALNDVDTRIADADFKIGSGNGKGAHSDLKDIRLFLMEVRRARGIPYFLDFMTDYAVAMEPITETAQKARDRGMALSDSELSTIKKKLAEARARWSAAQEFKFNPAEFGMNEDSEKALAAYRARVEGGLVALEEALKTPDRAAIAEAALALKPDFMRIYKMFGNFMRTSM